MSMIRSVYLSSFLLTAIAIVPCDASTQEGDMFVRVTPTEGTCPTDAFDVGFIGYKELECNCSFTIAPDGPRRYEFRAEPVIGGVEPGSPADGILRAGDVIAAIDGYLITTREGGRRFASIEPEKPVTLTVRRRGSELDVLLVPQHACYEVASLPPPRAPSPSERPSPTRRPTLVSEPNVVVGTSEPPVLPLETRVPPLRPTPTGATTPHPNRSAPPPPPPADLSSGWVGFSIRCVECRVGDENGHAVWEFVSYPEVDRVERESPAHASGIRSGDRLTHVNGHSITTKQGGKVFGAVEPGDTVTFRYMRNNTTSDARIIAATRLRYAGAHRYVRADAAPTVPEPVTRYSGVIGDVHVLVSGGPASVNRTDDEIVIQAGDITVRVKRTGRPEDGGRN